MCNGPKQNHLSLSPYACGCYLLTFSRSEAYHVPDNVILMETMHTFDSGRNGVCKCVCVVSISHHVV